MVETYRKRATPLNYIKVEQVNLVMKLLREQGVVLDGKYTSQGIGTALFPATARNGKCLLNSPGISAQSKKVLPIRGS